MTCSGTELQSAYVQPRRAGGAGHTGQDFSFPIALWDKDKLLQDGLCLTDPALKQQDRSFGAPSISIVLHPICGSMVLSPGHLPTLSLHAQPASWLLRSLLFPPGPTVVLLDPLAQPMLVSPVMKMQELQQQGTWKALVHPHPGMEKTHGSWLGELIRCKTSHCHRKDPRLTPNSGKGYKEGLVHLSKRARSQGQLCESCLKATRDALGSL